MRPSDSQTWSGRSRWSPDNDAVTSALILIDLQNDYFADPELARCRDDLLAHSNELGTWLADREVDRVMLTGVSTESCISATAVDAYARDLRVVLAEDATASIEWQLHDQALQRLHKQYRQEVRPVAEISFD
jgi:nicotinamidase-related amidase